MIRLLAIRLQVLRSSVYRGRCTVLLRRQNVRSICRLTHIFHFMRKVSTARTEKKMQLIDTIEPEQENNPEALYFGREYTEAFVEQLKEMLSPFENHVLYLHLMGTDYKKIAEILEKSPKSVDNAIQRIRGKARKCYGGEINSPPEYGSVFLLRTF